MTDYNPSQTYFSSDCCLMEGNVWGSIETRLEISNQTKNLMEAGSDQESQANHYSIFVPRNKHQIISGFPSEDVITCKY